MVTDNTLTRMLILTPLKWWSIMNRGLTGIYNHSSRKHLQRYVTSSVFATIHGILMMYHGSICYFEFKLWHHLSKFNIMNKREQVTIDGMQKAMAIEILPASELKKQEENQADFPVFIQKALKYDVKPKNKSKK